MVFSGSPLADYTVEDFDKLIATNVRGPFFLIQQLLPILGDGSNIIRDLLPRGASRSWEARFGQPFAPCLLRDQRNTRDSGQKLGGYSWTPRHSRECSQNPETSLSGSVVCRIGRWKSWMALPSERR